MITVGGMSSMEINPPNHLRISQTTDRTVPSIFLSQGFAAGALVPARSDGRQPDFLRSQQQGADGIPVERQRAARAAGRRGRGDRLQLEPARQQLAVDRCESGTSWPRQHQQPAPLPHRDRPDHG